MTPFILTLSDVKDERSSSYSHQLLRSGFQATFMNYSDKLENFSLS